MERAELTIPVSESDHSMGPHDAPVTLVQYGDFECPYCGAAYPVIKDVQRRMGDRLRFVFRNFPITTTHPHALRAAEAAEAAAAQGKFWEMHDMLYEHQDTLDDAHLRMFAEQIGLDVARFDREMSAGRYEDQVREDFMGGVRSGVGGTPTFYINGVRFDGNWAGENLLRAVEHATH
ncbi:MAG TPA: thioredoxin domain-containing protein [Chloroflexia bacterium]|nr:thioredoxin domain-containing protein [Chloroflexia bacterium]